MRRWILLAAAASMAAASTGQAFGWASLTTAPGFNVHGCLDKQAYSLLEADPAFKGAVFPTFDKVEDNEGVSITVGFHGIWPEQGVEGPGPDREGSTNYSEHYYNPHNREGKAPTSTGDWFVKLAARIDQDQAAAWGAHFLADTSVVYHVNGEYASDLDELYKMVPPTAPLVLPSKAVGNIALLNNPRLAREGGLVALILIPFVVSRGYDFRTEADRFREAAKDKPYYDWFDPWYWNGVTASPVTSSHLVYETLAGDSEECGAAPTAYSSLWPGNPDPQFEHPILAMRDVVEAFVEANAQSTVDNTKEFVNSPDTAQEQASTSIATLWRASISALRVRLTYALEPPSATEPTGGQVFIVKGTLANLADETPSDVQVQLTRTKGDCQVLTDHPQVQPVEDAAPGMHGAGVWRVQVPSGGSCEVDLEAIGKYAKTPDLGYAWKRVEIKSSDTEGTYKGAIKVTSSDFLSWKDSHSISGTITLVVKNGQVSGAMNGDFTCGSNPQYPMICGHYEGSIKGTVDKAGSLDAELSANMRTQLILGKLSGVIRAGNVTGPFDMDFVAASELENIGGNPVIHSIETNTRGTWTATLTPVP